MSNRRDTAARLMAAMGERFGMVEIQHQLSMGLDGTLSNDDLDEIRALIRRGLARKPFRSFSGTL